MWTRTARMTLQLCAVDENCLSYGQGRGESFQLAHDRHAQTKKCRDPPGKGSPPAKNSCLGISGRRLIEFLRQAIQPVAGVQPKATVRPRRNIERAGLAQLLADPFRQRQSFLVVERALVIAGQQHGTTSATAALR